MSHPIMAHLVIGYPSLDESFKTAQLYLKENIKLLELQIPFSHPTADGPVITLANQKAIEDGVTIEDCFEFIGKLKNSLDASTPLSMTTSQQEIMVMTYLNKIFTYGIDKFCSKLGELKVKYLIIPDLPYDSDKAKLIQEHPKINFVPVMGANTTIERLTHILSFKPKFIYIMSDYKMTGSSFSINPKIIALTKYITDNSNVKTGIGFGISDNLQVKEALKIADYAIIGSALIKAQQEGELQNKLTELLS